MRRFIKGLETDYQFFGVLTKIIKIKLFLIVENSKANNFKIFFNFSRLLIRESIKGLKHIIDFFGILRKEILNYIRYVCRKQ